MPSADRLTFDATALLDMLERTWRPGIRGVSLVTELDVDPVTAGAAADGLGRAYRRLRGGREYEIARRWPGCTVVAMTRTAVTEYRRGAFWPYWWKTTRYPGRDRDAKAWGELFLASLRSLRLPDFPELGMRRLALITMHAAVPDSCLDDFLLFLRTCRAVDPGLDAGELIGRTPAQDDRLAALDEPVRDLLRYGGDHARDLVDRCLDLLERLGGAESGEPDLTSLGLPGRFAEHAVELPTADLTPDGRDERPWIALAPFGEGVHVVLPRTAGIRWETRADGEPAEPGAGAAMTVRTPAGTVRVTGYGPAGETRSDISLNIVRPDNPLLVFGRDGRLLRLGQEIPSDAVWAAYPTDRALTADLPPRIIAESLLPAGWHGWRLVQVSTGGLAWLGLEGLEGAERHPVQGRDRPRVLTGEPVPGITTEDGSTVHATLPVIKLPDTGETRWLVDIRPYGSRVSVFSEPLGGAADRSAADRSDTDRGDTDHGDTELWGRASRPVLGTYVITVRGPIGRGVRRQVTIAEGLTAAYEPMVRLCDADGLEPAVATVAAGTGAAVTPAAVAFGGRQRQQVVTCTTAHATMRFLLTPPHMRVGTDRSGMRASPLELAIEDLPRVESLTVELPGMAATTPLEVVAGGHLVQELAPAVRGHYPVKRILDTVTAHGGAELVLPVGGRRASVATIRPAGYASGITRHGDHLTVLDCVWADGLTAGIYATGAPGGPELRPVTPDGTIVLPPALRNAGVLRILLQVEDPWLGTRWPDQPPPGGTLSCPQSL